MGQKESKSSISKSCNDQEIFEKKHKYFSIYFEDIDTEFNIKTSPRIAFDDFKKDLNKFFKIPESLNFRIESQKGPLVIKTPQKSDSQSIEDIFNEKLTNSAEMPQMIMSFENCQDFLFELEILMIKTQSIEYIILKSFLFFPLKFFLPQDYFRDLKCKLFRHSDSLFSDPLDIEKNLLFYNLSEKKIVLLAYFPNQADFLQISIFYKGNIYPKHVEKFMRLGELQDNFNKENNSYVVLCNKDSGLRIDYQTTLAQIMKNPMQMIFIAEDVEDYYRNINVVTEKPVFEITSHSNSKKNKKSSIDQPD